MEVLTALRERRSIRSYLNIPVEYEKLSRVLEAQELGLGTCWIGGFSEDQVKGILEIPENVRVVAMTPLGYPAEKPNAKPRKMLEEIVCYDKYK